MLITTKSYELSKAIGEEILETEALYNLKLVELYYESDKNESVIALRELINSHQYFIRKK